MKYAIVGSREYPDMNRVRRFVERLAPDDIVVSGGARGVDTVAEIHAGVIGLKVVSIAADWQGQGRGAGFLRNRLIVVAADCVVAFWDGASFGTAHTINTAREAGKPVYVFRPMYI